MPSTLALECLALASVFGGGDAAAGGALQREVHIMGASGNYHFGGKQRSVVGEKHPGGSQWRKAGVLRLWFSAAGRFVWICRGGACYLTWQVCNGTSDVLFGNENQVW